MTYKHNTKAELNEEGKLRTEELLANWLSDYVKKYADTNVLRVRRATPRPATRNFF